MKSAALDKLTPSLFMQAFFKTFFFKTLGE